MTKKQIKLEVDTSMKDFLNEDDPSEQVATLRKISDWLSEQADQIESDLNEDFDEDDDDNEDEE